MNISAVEYKKINEVMYIYEHRSGIKAFVIPKKGYSKKYATFSTHYGSINNAFTVSGERDVIRVPDGIAHFLEHKLFEQKDGNIMDKFSKMGASSNAYTSFNHTSYLFYATDRFSESFQLLLDFVQNPYLTDESVEKEKGIIGQEIKMYQDDAEWRVFFNLLGAFYKNNPVKIDIAGSVESISRINKEVLYKCYNTFYHPSNMVILVVGDVEHESVFEQVESSIGTSSEKPAIGRVFSPEEKALNKDYAEQALAVSMPIFQMGFRDNRLDTRGMECLMHEVAVRILLEIIMGRSSELYNRLYGEGLINSTFDFDFSIEENYAFSAFGGESVDPHKVKEKIIEKIKDIQKGSLDRDSCERIKKALKGRFIRQLNSVERISRTFTSVYFKDVNIFNYLDVYDKITFEYIKEIFDEHFKMDNLALSVIKPV